ncbi:MAG: DUF4265 domain-containing protein [Opitutales bacterium]|nr:DUF4265 domain-containing protein [Opitutales bacterium]
MKQLLSKLFGRRLYLVRFLSQCEEESLNLNEGIWCTRVGVRSFRVENLPFVTRGVSYSDTICGCCLGGEWTAEDVIRRGGYWNIWVVGETGIWEKLVSVVPEALVERASDERISIAGPLELFQTVMDYLQRGGVRYEISSPPES